MGPVGRTIGGETDLVRVLVLVDLAVDAVSSPASEPMEEEESL